MIVGARTTSGSVIFTTGFPDTEKMRVANNGNVGIGQTSPTTALEVSGTISATTLSAMVQA
jgi:hypothetical protein